MKKQSNILVIKFSKDGLADLTKEVKETIAFGWVEPQHKIFTAAELWNIRRQVKARVQRRYL
jgi:hypothetical protein